MPTYKITVFKTIAYTYEVECADEDEAYELALDNAIDQKFCVDENCFDLSVEEIEEL